MVFLMFMSASKHVLFALGVDPTAKDAMKGFRFRVSQATYFAVSCETSIRPCFLLHQQVFYGQPCKVSSKYCRVCHQSLLCTLHWPRGIGDGYEGGNRETCGASETCNLLSVQITHVQMKLRLLANSCCVSGQSYRSPFRLASFSSNHFVQIFHFFLYIPPVSQKIR